jgi:hypothetical protein
MVHNYPPLDQSTRSFTKSEMIISFLLFRYKYFFRKRTTKSRRDCDRKNLSFSAWHDSGFSFILDYS